MFQFFAQVFVSRKRYTHETPRSLLRAYFRAQLELGIFRIGAYKTAKAISPGCASSLGCLDSTMLPPQGRVRTAPSKLMAKPDRWRKLLRGRALGQIAITVNVPSEQLTVHIGDQKSSTGGSGRACGILLASL